MLNAWRLSETQVWEEAHNTLDNVSQWFCLKLMIWLKPWPLSEQGNPLFLASTMSLSPPVLLSLPSLLKRIIATYMMQLLSQFLPCRMLLSFSLRFSCTILGWSFEARHRYFTLETLIRLSRVPKYLEPLLSDARPSYPNVTFIVLAGTQTDCFTSVDLSFVWDIPIFWPCAL